MMSPWEIFTFAGKYVLMESVFNLPVDIFPANQIKGEKIIFHPYTAPVGSFSGRSLLSQNAISLVISGEKTMHFAEKAVEVRDDEFHFLSTGNCLVTMKLNESIPFKSFLIFFDNSILTDFYLKHQPRITEIQRNYHPAVEHYLSFKKDGFILNFIESLNLLFQSKAKISMEMKQLKFEELMLYMLETHPNRILAFQPASDIELDDFQVKKVVESNILSQISIEEMAFLCNMSLSTFKRRFTRIFKASPSRWILQKKMTMAKELLQRNGTKPGEIFYKLGYENHSSFTKSFKETFGITPREYQKKQLSFQR